MALKHVSFLFLFALLFSFNEIQARDSQMFNKIPSKTNEVVVEVKDSQQNLPNKEATEPSFKPDTQQEDEPNVVTQNNENNYGLYGHETTTTTNNQKFETNQNSNPQNNFPYNAKYLPKNYNTVAYVTQPEDFNDNSYTTTSTNNKNYYQAQDNSKSYYNAQKKDVTNEFDFMDNEDSEDTSVTDNTNKYYNNEAYNNNNNNRNSYYNNGNNFNTRFVDVPETTTNNKNNRNSYFNNDVVSNNNDNNFNTRFMDVHETSYDNNNNENRYYNNDVVSNNNDFNTRFTDIPETSNNNNNYYNSGKSRVVEPQGMSDTRFVENGRYHFDINTGKYSLDHPYMNPMAMRTQYNPNSYQYNNYNEEEKYQNEDNNMP